MSQVRKGLIGAGRAYSMMGVVVIAVLVWGLALPEPSQAVPGNWSFTGPMTTVRAVHTATVLPAGRVLVTGGSNSTGMTPLATAELYNPVAGSFSATTGSMGAKRMWHTATLLPNGQVLVAGGNNGSSEVNSAEVFHPLTGTFSAIAVAMVAARASHTATLLPSGKVLVAGGSHGPGALALAELYDPATGAFSPTGPMNVARRGHTATLLPSGKVLVTGGMNSPGNYLDSAELYNPVSGTWGLTDPMDAVRVNHTATLLLTGKVLVLGGTNASAYLDSARLYDPAFGTWSATGSLSAKRAYHTASLLLGGKVLVAGGIDGSNPLASAELYDPATGTFSPTGALGVPRGFQAGARLLNGKVLVAGGIYGSNPLASAELYEPEPPPTAKLPPLLAFYPFEGNAHDMSGNGRDGTVNGAPVLVAGYEGQAIYFNGTTDYLTLPLDINPDKYPRLTMGAWVWTGSAALHQPLLSHDNGGYDRAVGLDNRGSGIGWSAFCGPVGQVLGAVPAVLGAWTFVAVIYDQAAQTVRLQVNDMVLTKTGVTLGPGQNQLYLAASPPFSEFFNGAIDNVFVFGDVLTDQQLAYIRASGAKALFTATPGRNMATILELLLGD